MKNNIIDIMDRYVILVILFLTIVSCTHIDIKKYNLVLPDTIEINQLITVVSKIDSFELDYKVVDELILPVVFSEAGEEPPTPMTISYEELFSSFGDSCNSQKRIQDSIFIKMQVDTLYNKQTSRDLYKRFNSTYRKYYIFYKPIFSCDKKKAFVIYWKHCGAMCCTGYQLILEKINSKWVMINKRRYGMC